MPQLCYKGSDSQWHPLSLLVKGKDGLTTSVNGVEQADGDITLTAVNIPVSATDDTTVQTALTRRDRVVSLLDNGDFAINQRGQSTYTANGYAIDRWIFSTTSGGALNVQYGDARMYSPGSGYAEISQVVADSASLTGQAMTFAVRRPNGTAYAMNFTFGTDKEASFDGGKLTLIHYNADRVYIRIQDTGEQWISFACADLYRGTYTADTLPAHVSKGYAAELTECRRYYRPNEFLPCVKTSGNLFSVSQSIEMRTVPTVSFISFAPYGAANVTNFADCELIISKTADGVQRITYANLPTCAVHNAGGLAVNLNADYL